MGKHRQDSVIGSLVDRYFQRYGAGYAVIAAGVAWVAYCITFGSRS